MRGVGREQTGHQEQRAAAQVSGAVRRLCRGKFRSFSGLSGLGAVLEKLKWMRPLDSEGSVFPDWGWSEARTAAVNPKAPGLPPAARKLERWRRRLAFSDLSGK